MMAEHILKELREAVYKHNHQLTDRLYGTLQKFAEQCHPTWLLEQTPEYAQTEYLLNVDHAGQMIQPSPKIITQIQNHSILKDWFWISNNTLYMARWLAHLCGLRHRCIHLFLDPPPQTNTTYIQVRSLKKHNDPGCFDLPVAGHVSGEATFSQGLHTEASEELGLNLKTDVTHLRSIATNRIAVTPIRNRPEYFDVEYTTIYRATLTPKAYHHIRFIDGEVAALAQFQIDELATLIQTHPNRIAGGLLDSFPFYLKDHSHA